MNNFIYENFRDYLRVRAPNNPFAPRILLRSKPSIMKESKDLIQAVLLYQLS